MKRRTRLAAGIGAVTVVVAAGVATAKGFGGAEAGTPARSALPPATAQITRVTLTQTEKVPGTLGYGTPTVAAAHGLSGTLTWLAPEGRHVTRGQAVYKVDNEPVVLLYGKLPLYRELGPGLSGPDVELVERNLKKLGYDGFTADDDYTSATAEAVRDWQDDLGLPETGTVKPGQVLVAPGAVRVTDHKATPGAPARGAVLSHTDTTRSVVVHLDVAKQELVKKGARATVELPDDTTVPGRVTGIGTVVAGQAAKPDEPTTVEVTVSVKDGKKLGDLDGAPVEVILQAERRENVLAVPINALVALPGEGYGVQVVQGTSTSYARVETGMFAEGRVEISGTGLAEGMTVGVPA
ncbi:peptidoglycan-binding protein [Nonomuraea sp. NPDC050310]|uniref:peptidoglycan-binding protein n=1 Tax=Nonomuraea sp. NPDC050310 TaxID=3154935 RepID=UPI0033FA0420